MPMTIPTVDFLARRAGRGPALEFAIGTGRVALPLRARGVLVAGIEVYNGITCLLTQDQQVECFRNAARHLQPGGRFIIEVFVPALRRLPPGETARPFHVAGLELRERWADWNQTPFTADGTSHVSVWHKPDSEGC